MINPIIELPTIPIISPAFWGTASSSRRRNPLITGSTVSEQIDILSIEIRSLQGITQKAFDEFVEQIQKVPSVEQIRSQVGGTYMHIVTYMCASSLEERERVYEAEKALYQRYTDLRFEFDLIDRRGLPITVGEISNKYIRIVRQLPDEIDEHQV